MKGPDTRPFQPKVSFGSRGFLGPRSSECLQAFVGVECDAYVRGLAIQGLRASEFRA